MAWTKMKTAVVAGVGILIAMGTTAIVVSKIEPLPPIKSLPNPNGYDDLVKAATMVSGDNLNFDSTNLAQLQAMTTANVQALALARTGLSKECRVPLQFTQAYNEKHLNDLAGMKRLAQAFITEGKMAEMENRPNDAIKSYLDTVHLANESSRGGDVIDYLVGDAIEGIGTGQLARLADKLDAKACRETAKVLEALDIQRPTWDDVALQEHAWSRRTFTGIRYAIQRIMEKKSMESMYAAAKLKNQKYPKITRQLIVQFAVRAYTLDKGNPPGSVDDLVPDYLEGVPIDPITGDKMVYAPK